MENRLIGVVLRPRGYAWAPVDCVVCHPRLHRDCGCTRLCQRHMAIWREGQVVR
jgi:hypothetical protein